MPTEMRQVWFAFCPSTEGPWIALKLQCRKKGTVPQFESLFREVIEQLQPIECVLCNTNVDTLPCLAHSSYRGGITAIVNCNVEPPVELRPGQPGWFEALGIELRYFSGHLLDQHAIDPAVRASQFAQTFMPVGDGFVFDGGWGNHWQKVLSPTPGRNRPRPAASLRRLVNR
ncbi:MAG TPA: hypothetical protein VFQ91_13610 [Bryobacteraceae bacterium]|nr:hypothetical protein [Bryobacteraceae bacterium]